MVVIPPIDAPAGEAIWRLLTGAAQDSWEAICKHSHLQSHPTHTSTPELRPRRGGGGGGGGDDDNNNSERADSGRGSGSNSNNNNNNNDDDDSNNRGSTGKTTTADDETTTAADPTTTTVAAAKTTSTTKAAAAATTSTTTAAAATTTAAVEASAATTAAAAANTEAADTTTAQAAAAATTTAQDAAAQTAANDGNNDTAAAAAATETAAAATAAAQDGATAATQATGDTATAAAVAAATQAAGAESETTYVNTNGQTTTRNIAATTNAATGTISAATATGTSTSSTASGSSAETASTSNTELIAGCVVGAILFLVLAFAVYWFRRSKYFKALCCCCGVGGRGGASSKNDGGDGEGSNNEQSRTRNMADSNARLMSHASAGSLLTPMSSAAPATAARYEKRGYNDMSEKMNYYGSDAKSRAVFHDDEKREMAARDRNLNLRPPPPVSMHNAPRSPTSPLTPLSAVSSSSTLSSSSTTTSSASAHKPAHRQRSPSYSTFPLTTRSHNYSNSITRAQAGATSASLPTPPPTAVQKERQASHASQSSQSGQPGQSAQHYQKQKSVPRVAVQVAELPAEPPTQTAGFPFKEQPIQRMSRTAPSPLALSALSKSPEGLAPPPRNATSRQRQSTASHDGAAIHEKDTDDTASLAPTFNRSSYTESIGGDSISSSVLMSPALLHWPVPPNTPPVSQFGSEAGGALSASNSNSNLSSSSTIPAGRSKSQESIESGSTDTNSQGSGPLFDRVAIVPSHVPTVVSAANLPVPRRPLTTVSSVSSSALGQNPDQNQVPVPPMPSRGSMPTRASLSGPSSRTLMQMQSARRPSVASSGGSGGSGSIGQAVSGPPPTRPPYPPYAYSQGSQSPRSPRGPPPPPGSPHAHGMPIYQQQKYPHPQRLPPTGYIPPQASAVTVHHTGQATSVRVPIARNPQPQRY